MENSQSSTISNIILSEGFQKDAPPPKKKGVIAMQIFLNNGGHLKSTFWA